MGKFSKDHVKITDTKVIVTMDIADVTVTMKKTDVHIDPVAENVNMVEIIPKRKGKYKGKYFSRQKIVDHI